MIKVVCDLRGKALYFSREPIPSRSRFSEVDMGKQICVIPFKRDFLIEYNSLPETPLEKFESIDMNRVLEHGLEVAMVKTSYNSYSVDTKSDLEKVAKLLEKDRKMNSDLSKSKKVLITGASTGIGFACLKKFLENRWKVIAHYYESNEDFHQLSEKMMLCN